MLKPRQLLWETQRGHLSVEHVFHEGSAAPEDVRRDVFEYIKVFYNRGRRHFALRCCSPPQHYAVWVSEKKLAA